MLEHLFGSRTRVKLMGLFLRHPDEPLFVREITRRIGTQINAVRRELANLVRLGLLTEAVVSAKEPAGRKAPGLKRRYYKVNRSFVLLPEVTALIIKARVLLERQLDQEILKLGDVRYLSLMGMFLGMPAPLDLFIVGHVNDELLKKLLQSTEADLGFEINFSLMTPEEYKERKDIGDKFLQSVMQAQQHEVVNRLHERLAE